MNNSQAQGHIPFYQTIDAAFSGPSTATVPTKAEPIAEAAPTQPPKRAKRNIPNPFGAAKAPVAASGRKAEEGFHDPIIAGFYDARFTGAIAVESLLCIFLEKETFGLVAVRSASAIVLAMATYGVTQRKIWFVQFAAQISVATILVLAVLSFRP